MTRMPGSPRTLLKAGTIVTMDSGRRVLRGGALVLNGSTIEAVCNADELRALREFDGKVIDEPRSTIIPGFP